MMKTRILCQALRALAIASFTAGLTLPSLATTYTWTKTAKGSYNWNATANWSPNTGFPNAIGDVANITADAGGYVTNALNQATATVGILNIGDTDMVYRNPFRIVPTTSGNALVFNNGTAPAQLNQISTSNGDLIAAPVQIANALTVSSATSDKSLTISGAISGSGSTLTKAGLGELLLTSANTFGGLLSVQSGRLVGTAQASGSPFGASTNAIQIGGSDRLVAGYVPTLTLANPTSASTTTFGDVTAGGSFNSGYLAPGAKAAGTSYLQGGNLSRNAGASLVISPLTTTSLANLERVQFSGSGTSLVNGILPPWLVVSLNNGDFASYGANGIARATYTSTTFNSSLTTQVVNLASTASLAAPQTAYAVRMGYNLNLNGNTLTLGDGTTGGLILLNNTTLSNSGAGSLAFGSGELMAYVDAANFATISAPISNSGIFRKFGTGTLILTQPTLPDTINLQAGGLALNPTADFTYTGNIYGAGTLYKDGATTVSLDGIAWTLGGIWTKQGTLRLSAVTVTNLNALVLGPTINSATSPSSTLVITNGSRVVQMAGGAIVGKASANYTVKNHAVIVAGAHPVSGAKATWNLGNSALHIGVTANPSTVLSNSVTVASGGMITNAASIIVGSGSGGSYQKMTIANGGQVFGTSCTIGANQSYSTAGVTGNDSLLNLGGGALTIGLRNDIMIEKCSLLISGNGAIVTNASTLTVGTAGGNASFAISNSVVVIDGGALFTRGAATIGTITASSPGRISSENSVKVTGAQSRWNAGGAAILVGSASQGNVRENVLWIEQGGLVTNAVAITIGSPGAGFSLGNQLVVTNGGSFYSSGTVYIGKAQGPSQANFSNSNLVHVVGGPNGNSRWNLGNAAMTIGYTPSATAGCVATGNVVRVSRGGTISGVGALSVYNRPGYSGKNKLILAGGSITATSLSLGTGNSINPSLDAQGLTAMTVTGAATFSAGSWVDPSATRDAPAGTYTVLTAGSIVTGGNLTLAPGTDESIWKLQVTSTQVKITKKDRATLLQIR